MVVSGSCSEPHPTLSRSWCEFMRLPLMWMRPVTPWPDRLPASTSSKVVLPAGRMPAVALAEQSNAMGP